MSLKFSSSVVFVKDIQKSRKFYTEVLEQEVLHDFGACVILKCGVSLWQIGANHIIARESGIDEIKSRISGKFELCFESDDIQSIFEKVKASGVDFLHTIHEEPWGQFTFRLYDLDGHLVEVGEFLETFVKRIFKDTKSIEATAERTGVNAETVKSMISKE